MVNRLSRDAFDTTIDRSKALALELERLNQKWYPPTGPNRLLNLAINANNRVLRDLEALLPGSSGTSEQELEILLRSKTKLLAFLHVIIQFLDGASGEECPGTFVFPLRQILKSHLDDFDFVVRSTRVYNYRVIEIRKTIEKLFEQSGYLDLLNRFPAHFFIVECPIAEKGNVLMHSMFAHEVSHRIYDVKKMGDRLVPLARQKLSDTEVQTLINEWATRPIEPGPGEQEQTMEDIFRRWRVEYSVRFKLHQILSKWVDEMTSDAMALRFLGPAYLFAFVQFALPFAAMDEAADSHPPHRMRIRFACDMLTNQHEGLGYNTWPDKQTKAYIDELITKSAKERARLLPNRFHRLVADAIELVSKEIMLAAKDTARKQIYSAVAFNRDVPQLCRDCLALGIPPNEIVVSWTPPGKRRLASAAAILNAGWVFILNQSSEYAKLLGTDNLWLVRTKIRNLVSKAMEYSELQQLWGRKK